MLQLRGIVQQADNFSNAGPIPDSGRSQGAGMLCTCMPFVTCMCCNLVMCSGSLLSSCTSNSEAIACPLCLVLDPENHSMLVQDVATAAGVTSGVRLQV